MIRDRTRAPPLGLGCHRRSHPRSPARAALAGSPTVGVNQSAGKVGKHHLQDSEAAPAGSCKHGYDPEGPTEYYNGVRRVIVKRPIVFARAGRDTQRITWRVVIQAWPSAGSAWTFVDKTEWQSRTATPDARAPFKRKTVLIDSYPHHGEWGSSPKPRRPALARSRWQRGGQRAPLPGLVQHRRAGSRTGHVAVGVRPHDGLSTVSRTPGAALRALPSVEERPHRRRAGRPGRRLRGRRSPGALRTEP